MQELPCGERASMMGPEKVVSPSWIIAHGNTEKKTQTQRTEIVLHGHKVLSFFVGFLIDEEGPFLYLNAEETPGEVHLSTAGLKLGRVTLGSTSAFRHSMDLSLP